MPDYVVSNIFRGKDQLSPIYKKLGKAVDKFGDRSSRAFKRSSREALTFKKIIGGILAAGAIQRGFSLLQQGVQGVGEEFVNFDQSLTSAAAKFPEKIARGTKAFEQLGATARRIGAETQFSAADAAGGLEFLAMAGFDARQAMALLPGTVDLATTSNLDLARATDIASDALGIFGMMTKDTSQLTTNLSRINDVFAATVTSSNTTLEMLFEAMKDGGPATINAGHQIETFSAAVGTLSSAGLKGERAGTALRNIFLRLAAPVDGAKTLLKKLNITVEDSEGNMRDIFDILGDLNRAFKGMGDVEKQKILDKIFGKRAIAAASILLQEGSQSLKDYRSQLEASGGAAKKMAVDMRKSIQNRLLELRSAAIETGFRFIDAFADKIPGGIDKAISAVRQFDVKPIIEGVRKFVDFLKKIPPVLREMAPFIKTAVALWVGYRAAVTAFMALNFIMSLLQLTKVIFGVVKAQGLLNLVMMLNPIGVVAAAIGILIGLLVLAAFHIEEVTFFWDTMTEEFALGVDTIVSKVTFMAKAIGIMFQRMAEWALEKINSLIKGVSDFLGLETDFTIDIKALGLKDTKGKMDALFEEEQERLEWRKAINDDHDRSRLHALKNLTSEDRERQKGIEDFVKTQTKVFEGKRLQKAMPTSELFVPGLEIPGVTREAPVPEREAPNVTEVATRRQEMTFKGRLDIAGAPEGSKFTQEKRRGSAPSLQVEMLGANP
jgi:TP901 family phage tail tape measure protein